MEGDTSACRRRRATAESNNNQHTRSGENTDNQEGKCGKTGSTPLTKRLPNLRDKHGKVAVLYSEAFNAIVEEALDDLPHPVGPGPDDVTPANVVIFN